MLSDIVVMGVSGSGKSTIGRALAARLGRVFVEGDDHHPASNRKKMASGSPLTNADRKGWISDLATAVNAGPPAVVSCSALNATVRDWLETGFQRSVTLVHLTAPKVVLAARLAARKDHFFDPALLDSQFAALEAPQDVITISVDRTEAEVLQAVIEALEEN